MIGNLEKNDIRLLFSLIMEEGASWVKRLNRIIWNRYSKIGNVINYWRCLMIPLESRHKFIKHSAFHIYEINAATTFSKAIVLL